MKRKTVEKNDAVGSVKASKGKRGISDTSKESAHLLHSIVQGFSIPAFVIGANHKVLYWNRALEKSDEYSHERGDRYQPALACFLRQ